MWKECRARYYANGIMGSIRVYKVSPFEVLFFVSWRIGLDSALRASPLRAFSERAPARAFSTPNQRLRYFSAKNLCRSPKSSPRSHDKTALFRTVLSWLTTIEEVTTVIKKDLARF